MQSDDFNILRQTDHIDLARAQALAVTLGDDGALSSGDPLPAFFHHAYFWEPHPKDQLGRDGHPRVGQGLIHDLGLPRRMWAGGTVTFAAPLMLDRAAVKRSRCAEVTQKMGRSGPLGFIKLVHEYWQADTLCVREVQNLVYRPDAAGGDAAPKRIKPQITAVHSREVSFDSTQLFRYSALTFNGHRIHYDLDYARDVEGYAGLVVHGPLLAQLLIRFIEAQCGALRRFAFRGVAPLMHDETARLCVADQAAWVETAEGHLVMQAEFDCRAEMPK